MAKKKEALLRKFALATFASLSAQTEGAIEKERGGIKEGTKGISGARIIDISRIKPDLEQPRKSFDWKSLKGLAKSIEEHGLLQPIIVEYLDRQDYFKIINGARRYEAAKLAGLLEIPCVIKNVDRHLRLIYQLIENIQRQDLPVLEEAEAIQTLIKNRRMEDPNYSQRQVSRELGLPKSYVNEMLTLLKLPKDIIKSVQTSDTFPKSLLLLLARQGDGKKIREFYKQIKQRKLTVHEAKVTLARSKNRRGRPRCYQYIFRAPQKEFTLTIKFRKTPIDQSELIDALSQVLRNLRQEKT